MIIRTLAWLMMYSRSLSDSRTFSVCSTAPMPAGCVVRLEMARPVPHERADSVADDDAGITQRVCELVRTVAQLSVASDGACRLRSP